MGPEKSRGIYEGLFIPLELQSTFFLQEEHILIPNCDCGLGSSFYPNYPFYHLAFGGNGEVELKILTIGPWVK